MDEDMKISQCLPIACQTLYSFSKYVMNVRVWKSFNFQLICDTIANLILPDRLSEKPLCLPISTDDRRSTVLCHSCVTSEKSDSDSTSCKYTGLRYNSAFKTRINEIINPKWKILRCLVHNWIGQKVQLHFFLSNGWTCTYISKWN